MRYKHLVISFILILGCNSSVLSGVDAQASYALPNTLITEFKSNINDIKYNLYISLPKGYDLNKNYPVIYLLDADYSFALAKQISEHLSDRSRIKQSIIVGIAYVNKNEYKKNRTRDYTPSFVSSGGYGPEYQKFSGGAELFYHVLQDELIPFITKNYKVKNDRTLVGHSYGGLFGVYLLLNHPEVFDQYLIVSPSLWYDKQLLLKNAKNRRDLNQKQKTNVCFIIGDQENKGDYRMINDLKTLNQIMNSKPHSNLSFNLHIIKNMDHDTIFPGALSQGLLILDNPESLTA